MNDLTLGQIFFYKTKFYILIILNFWPYYQNCPLLWEICCLNFQNTSGWNRAATQKNCRKEYCMDV